MSFETIISLEYLGDWHELGSIDYAITEKWISFDQLSGWETIKALGDWTIRYAETYHAGQHEYYIGGEQFTVVPEPISSTLFLIGGAALGFRRFRKK